MVVEAPRIGVDDPDAHQSSICDAVVDRTCCSVTFTVQYCIHKDRGVSRSVFAEKELLIRQFLCLQYFHVFMFKGFYSQ